MSYTHKHPQHNLEQNKQPKQHKQMITMAVYVWLVHGMCDTVVIYSTVAKAYNDKYCWCYNNII